MSNPITIDNLATAIVNNKNLATQNDVSTLLPDQTSNPNKFLTTDGSNLSWGEVDVLPNQASNGGKFLTTDGTTTSWADAGGGGSGGASPTEVDVQTLADDSARNTICYGDRRYNWFITDQFIGNQYLPHRSIMKLFNGIRGGTDDDSATEPGDQTAPYQLRDGGILTLEPTNSVHYKFRGIIFIDKNAFGARMASNFGVWWMNDARFAAYGYKNNKWFWLGTCSMDNSSVDTSNNTDHLIPTIDITDPDNNGSPGDHLPYGDFAGYSCRWAFTHNIDFYQKYRIKHVKLGRTSIYSGTAFQDGDNMNELEFF